MTTPHAFQIEDFIGAPNGEGEQYFASRHFADMAAIDDHHYWHLHRRTVILDTLDDYVRRGARLVEVGCGVGTVATYLNQHGHRVDYADVHREALAIAAERARTRLPAQDEPRRFLRLDVTQHPLPAAYEGALLLDVLEHLPNDLEVLEALTNQLRRQVPGAIVLFTVPAFQFLWSPWDDLNDHRRRYTRSSATELATRAGLTVLRSTYFFFPLFFAASAVKATRSVAKRIRPGTQASRMSELVETKSPPLLNAAMLRVLELERKWLRQRDLPAGTSLLCVARVPS